MRLYSVRAFLLCVYYVVTLIPTVIGILLCWPFPHQARFFVARSWSRGMLWAGRIICGLDWVVEGRENLPSGPSVLYIKHSSVFETYAQIGLFPRQTWVVKKELLFVPILGWGVAAMRCIAIDRRASGKAVKQVIEQGKERLASGIWVTIFPEGTRMDLGETRRYGISGAALARDAGCLVVPVAHNASNCFPRNGLPKRPGLIRFCIGPPVDPSAQEPKETNKVAQAWIESKMAEICEEDENHGH